MNQNNTGLYQRGGGANRSQWNPCPILPGPNWSYFIDTGANIDGSHKYFCCEERYRTEACVEVTDMTRLEGLLSAEVTNFDNGGGRRIR